MHERDRITAIDEVSLDTPAGAGYRPPILGDVGDRHGAERRLDTDPWRTASPEPSSTPAAAREAC